ncbi:MAG: ATP synthase F1 subunit delta [Phycisphaerae bacterium]|nr:ATP synthase F1 subunit delta [Phycisphaerae bacterium]
MIGTTLRLAHTYARVLFGLAEEAACLEEVREDLNLISTLMERHPDFGQVLVSPYFSLEDKRRLLHRVLSGRTAALTLEFLGLLVRRRRTALLGPIRDLYGQCLDRRNGLSDVTVTLARAPSEQETGRLSRDLESALGRPIRMKVLLDPEIVGGIVIRYDGRVIDNSLTGRLNRAVREVFQRVQSRAYEV